MKEEKARRVLSKIKTLERFLSRFERQNKDVTQGLLKIRRNLHRYF